MCALATRGSIALLSFFGLNRFQIHIIQLRPTRMQSWLCQWCLYRTSALLVQCKVLLFLFDWNSGSTTFSYTGQSCNTPVCLPGCDFGGCTVPDTCVCNSGFEISALEVEFYLHRFQIHWCVVQHPSLQDAVCIRILCGA